MKSQALSGVAIGAPLGVIVNYAIEAYYGIELPEEVQMAIISVVGSVSSVLASMLVPYLLSKGK